MRTKMNKYQEAKETLEKYDYSTKLELSEGIKNNITSGITVEQFFMMKDACIELLDKATPMKPFKETQDIIGRPLKTEANLLTRLHYSCPRCRISQQNFYPYSFCAKCGQKIDWSKDE